MLGFAQTGQVCVNGGDQRAPVAEIDLDLAEVLALFEQVSRVRMAQTMNVSGFLDAAGLEGEAEGALERGAAHWFGGGGGAQTAVTFGGKKQRGMTMAFPEFAQELKCALRQGNVTILVAFAGADVEEHALRIDVRDLQARALSQAQAAGVNGGQADPMIQGANQAEDAADFGGGENDGEFELGIGADQFQFVRPGAFESFFPEEFEGADDLGAGLACDFLDGLEVNAVLAELFGGD